MPKKAWTTPEQAEWLHARMPGFLDAQSKLVSGTKNKNSLKSYFVPIYKDWEAMWPHPPPTPLQLEETKGDTAAAKAKVAHLWKNRVYYWFFNHTREGGGGASGGGVQDFLKLKRRRLQPYLVYLKLCNDELKALVDKKWDEHLATVPAGQQKSRLAFATQIYHEEWNKAGPDVKEKVENLREELFKEGVIDLDLESDADNGDDKDAEDGVSDARAPRDKMIVKMQQGIDRIPATAKAILTSFTAQTGWPCMVICGGPVPRNKGKLKILCYANGKTKDTDEEFEHASDEYETFVGIWDDFIQRCFPESVCERLALPSSASLSSKSPSPSPSNGSTTPAATSQATTENGALKSVDQQQPPTSVDSQPPSTSHHQPNASSIGPSSSKSPSPPNRSTTPDPTSQEIPKDDDVRNSIERQQAPTTVSPRPPSPSPKSSDVSLQTEKGNGDSMPGIDNGTNQPSPEGNLDNDREHGNRGTQDAAKDGDGTEGDETRGGGGDGGDEGGEGGEGEDVAIMPPPLDPNPPVWYKQAQVHYLQIKPLGDGWSDLICYWMGIQKLLGYKSNTDRKHWLPNKCRPDEFKVWQTENKKLSFVPEFDVPDFAYRWRLWWESLQPEWRASETWPPCRDVPDDVIEDWAGLQKCGSNGLHLIVASLNWWGHKCSSAKDRKGYTAAREEVTWVFQQVYAFLLDPKSASHSTAEATVPAKRTRGTPASGNANKRRRCR